MVITSESIRIEHEVDDHSEVRRLTEELTRTRAECEQYKAEAERVTAVLQNTIARFMADAASFHRDKSELQAAFDTLRAEQSHNLARAAAPVSTQVATPDHNTPPSWWKRWLRLLFSSKRGRGRH
ncbi:hypothetical protein BKA62DRAFT_184680 [Auriculariales sp. MPI-PUGE-AT-0066]|nr:hypothetical protein BKA62DRAFT_184680 [Auriculariales sp. MPI-PUGE-AT-0066]